MSTMFSKTLKKLRAESGISHFPQALIVAGGKLACDTIEDRITEVKGLLDYMVK